MKIITTPQRTPEWLKLRAGSIGGTRFSKATSGKKNRLVYELIAEKLGYTEEDGFVTEDMQFGIDNERFAADLYSEQSGIRFKEIGMLKSEHSDIHHASPDRLSECETIVLEIKSTQHPAIHIERYYEGFGADMPQVWNYFAVADEIKEVHLVSYCPFMEERPLHGSIFTRFDCPVDIEAARLKIKELERVVNDRTKEFLF